MGTHTDPVVRFYWRPGCPFCVALRARLRRRGIRFEAINIWESPDAAALVRSVADGNETVPTVFVGDQAMVNPSAEQVASVVADVAPHLVTEAPRRRWLRWR